MTLHPLLADEIALDSRAMTARCAHPLVMAQNVMLTQLVVGV
jgi:hypothetical protein